MLAADGGCNLSHEEIHRDHRVEIVCTSRRAAAYVAMRMLPRHGSTKARLDVVAAIFGAFLKVTGANAIAPLSMCCRSTNVQLWMQDFKWLLLASAFFV